jgi:virginiamycin A acetyltransferase
MSDIIIGNGVVIANNSHVVKNIEPYSIYGGNPAKLIKYRFEKNIIDELLKIKWWNWTEDKINYNIHLLCDENKINDFISNHKRIDN